MERIAIGVDVGTSGVRMLAMDAHGRILGSAARKLPATKAEGRRRTQEPDSWWEALVGCSRDLREKADLSGAVALSIDGTSGTLLPVAANGMPTGPARMYDDADTEDLAERVAALAPAESAAHGPSSAAARALQLSADPAARWILHQADWMLLRLGAPEPVTDENNALKTGYDPVARAWPEWLGRLGLDRHRLPKVLPVGTAAGRISTEAARLLGLPADVQLVAGTTDGCAGFLASGASEIGDAATSLGSTLVLKLLGDRPVFSPTHGVYSHRIGDRWLIGGASNCGGRTLLAHFTPEAMAGLERRMDAESQTGLDYYPLPSPGERFPVADRNLAPRLTPRPTDDAKFLQGMLEGLAKVEADGYAKLQSLGGPRLRSVRHLGGGARSATWMKLRATALGAPCLAAIDDEAAAGTARVAWLGLGIRPPTSGKLRKVAGLGAIKDHDVLLVDQFGTLHDGTRPYPGAAEALSAFRRRGGKVVVMSNSAKPGTDNVRRLARMGFGSEHFDAVVTSGDVALRLLTDGSLGEGFRGRKAHLSGRPGETYGLDALGLDWTSPDAADFIIVAASREPDVCWKTQVDELMPAVSRGAPVLVINPDIEMLTPAGVRPSAGAIGRELAARGAAVTCLGKPGPDICRLALVQAGVRPSRRVLVVGDSPEHDLAAAASAGLSGMLVRTGIMTGVSDSEIEPRLPTGEWLSADSLRP